jgi:adenine-specific DNA-methyltransferase
LDKFRSVLEKRREVENGKINYFDLQWSRSEDVFTGEKIVAPYRSRFNCFGYTTKEWFCRSDCYVIYKPKSEIGLKYLSGLLNSKLYYFWLFANGKKKGNILELFSEPLEQIPIPLQALGARKKIESAVEKLISEQKKSDRSSTYLRILDDLNKQIYEIFGLTSKEIAYVESLYSRLAVETIEDEEEAESA